MKVQSEVGLAEELLPNTEVKSEVPPDVEVHPDEGGAEVEPGEGLPVEQAPPAVDTNASPAVGEVQPDGQVTQDVQESSGADVKLDEEVPPHAEEKLDVESSPDADVEVRPHADEKLDAVLSPDDDVEVRPDADDKLDVELSPDAPMEARPDVDEKLDAELSPDTDVEARPDVDEELDAELSPDAPMRVRPDVDEKLDTELSPDADVEARPNFDDELDVESSPGADVEVRPDANEKLDVESSQGADVGPDVDAARDADSMLDVDAPPKFEVDVQEPSDLVRTQEEAEIQQVSTGVGVDATTELADTVGEPKTAASTTSDSSDEEVADPKSETQDGQGNRQLCNDDADAAPSMSSGATMDESSKGDSSPASAAAAKRAPGRLVSQRLSLFTESKERRNSIPVTSAKSQRVIEAEELVRQSAAETLSLQERTKAFTGASSTTKAAQAEPPRGSIKGSSKVADPQVKDPKFVDPKFRPSLSKKAPPKPAPVTAPPPAPVVPAQAPAQKRLSQMAQTRARLAAQAAAAEKEGDTGKFVYKPQRQYTLGAVAETSALAATAAGGARINRAFTGPLPDKGDSDSEYTTDSDDPAERADAKFGLRKSVGFSDPWKPVYTWLVGSINHRLGAEGSEKLKRRIRSLLPDPFSANLDPSDLSDGKLLCALLLSLKSEVLPKIGSSPLARLAQVTKICKELGIRDANLFTPPDVLPPPPSNPNALRRCLLQLSDLASGWEQWDGPHMPT